MTVDREVGVSRSQLEVWENAIAGTIVLKKFDHRGDPARDEIVTAGRTVHLSPAEREVNEDMVMDPALNPFRNGMLRPVKLVDDSEEARELANNPNVMSESDMNSLLKGSQKAFLAKLELIKNPYALQRLLKNSTAPDADVLHSKVEAIKSKLEEIAPHLLAEMSGNNVVYELPGQAMAWPPKAIGPK